MARGAFDDALGDLDCCFEEPYKVATTIMQMLRDNLHELGQGGDIEPQDDESARITIEDEDLVLPQVWPGFAWECPQSQLYPHPDPCLQSSNPDPNPNSNPSWILASSCFRC